MSFFAIFLILFQLFAPLAIAQTQGQNQVLICSQQGNYTLTLDDAGNPISPNQTSQHCKLCLMNLTTSADISAAKELKSPLHANYIVHMRGEAVWRSHISRAYDATAPPILA